MMWRSTTIDLSSLRKWALLALAAAVPAPAHAANVTYLECMMSTGGSEQALWKIALDEGGKTVSFEHPLARGARPAIFTADKVSWNDGRLSISRLVLTFTRNSLGATDIGKCKVVAPPRRAF